MSFYSISFYFISFCFISFRFILSRFISSRFTSTTYNAPSAYGRSTLLSQSRDDSAQAFQRVRELTPQASRYTHSQWKISFTSLSLPTCRIDAKIGISSYAKGLVGTPT
ncbi:hypothetical protein P152DRAFT_153438 [Eremomyces bilateralis CBS 781.70]|uniref:Uncharacterized protein n=1 Tax=Eremomyces bilateralis CBS 781.70 TaxID=1392243 RepID=A0A6G1FVB6_9PEZI|nr:uncharacterized protein P152DRAFT_153438 [Eremomyces bilateralis CBS 781.70]KAF1809589.1 hypothetical protein P152DRAFT_153438 [Eremomyces bilateralis CBS 781.70]